MRVIAGTHRGRRLEAPAGRATRPTSDRVREAVFSILGERVRGARVLDLFAGSGALGIEALSRGAARATFVDHAAPAIAAIRANLRRLGLCDRATVLQRDVLRALGRASECTDQYDLVFIDPPYRIVRTLGPRFAALPALLAPGATVVTESGRGDPALTELPLQRERQYGHTVIRIHGN